MPRFKNTSLGPVSLSSGRVLSAGEDTTIDPTDENPITDEDQRHIDAGRLTEIGDKPNLEDLTRSQLESIAIGLAIDAPEKLPNKDAVITAIRDAEEA